MTQQEEWRPVVGWEGLYEVSSFGRVRSLDRVTICLGRKGQLHRRRYVGRLLAQTLNPAGYPTIRLKDQGRQETKGVHVLVCTAFHGPRPPKNVCCHGDGTPSNNFARNLRWDTPSANLGDMEAHGTAAYGARHPQATLSAEQVRQIRQASGLSQRELGRQFGVSSSLVSLIRSGKTRNVPGYE